MIESSLGPQWQERACSAAEGIDWKNAWLGQVDGEVRAWPEAAARAVGVPCVDAATPLLLTSVLEPMRAEPMHRAEMVSEVRADEVLLGVLHRDEWWLLQSSDGYVGWVHEWVLAEGPRTTPNAVRGRYARPLGTLWLSDSYAAGPLRMGDVLYTPEDAAVVERGDWSLVSTVLGGEGWVRTERIEPISPSEDSIAGVLRRLRSLVGTPYRWGGRSPLGFDCSGLVQFVFGLEGVALPRDASQQAECGTPVASDDAVRGDLVFFGEPVDHVGVLDGRGRLLHCRRSVVNERVEDLGELMARVSGVRRLIG